MSKREFKVVKKTKDYAAGGDLAPVTPYCQTRRIGSYVIKQNE